MRDGMSQNIEIYQPTEEFDAGRTQYVFEHHAERSKARGDYHFLKAQALTGLGDYAEGDHECQPQGAR
jgi:hypothetical protein